MLDSNRPREEWDISHVGAESQPAQFASEPVDLPNRQGIIVTTHEEEVAELNKVLKDHMSEG